MAAFSKLLRMHDCYLGHVTLGWICSLSLTYKIWIHVCHLTAPQQPVGGRFIKEIQQSNKQHSCTTASMWLSFPATWWLLSTTARGVSSATTQGLASVVNQDQPVPLYAWRTPYAGVFPISPLLHLAFEFKTACRMQDNRADASTGLFSR